MNALHFINIEWLLVYAALGALVGFLAGLLGVGGGGILVPLLASLFAYQGMAEGYQIHLALGTALTCMIITSAASTRAHHARGAVVWNAVGGMAFGIIIGAYSATQIAANINAAYIAVFFAFIMGLAAVQMFVGWQPPVNEKPATQAGLLGVGMGIGAVSALAAIGGGFFTILYLSYRNIDIKKAIGTSSAIGFPIAVTGTIGYMIGGWSETTGIPYTLGYVYLPAFVMISIGSLIAAPIGVRWSHRLPGSLLKKILAVISLLLSVKMLLSVI